MRQIDRTLNALGYPSKRVDSTDFIISVDLRETRNFQHPFVQEASIVHAPITTVGSEANRRSEHDIRTFGHIRITPVEPPHDASCSPSVSDTDRNRLAVGIEANHVSAVA